MKKKDTDDYKAGGCLGGNPTPKGKVKPIVAKRKANNKIAGF